MSPAPPAAIFAFLASMIATILVLLWKPWSGTPFSRDLPTPPSIAGQPSSFKPIFNGLNLDGWKHVGKGRFMVENGVLKTEGGMGLLWYREPLADVAIRVVYRNPGGANSGVFVRIPERPTDAWMPVNRGYEIQICDHGDDYHVTGVLYSFTKAAARPNRPDEWNTMEIALAGDRTTITVNGVLVTDYREGSPVPPKKQHWEPDRGPRPAVGYMGLQNHSARDVVYFREVSIHPIAPR